MIISTVGMDAATILAPHLAASFLANRAISPTTLLLTGTLLLSELLLHPFDTNSAADTKSQIIHD